MINYKPKESSNITRAIIVLPIKAMFYLLYFLLMLLLKLFGLDSHRIRDLLPYPNKLTVESNNRNSIKKNNENKNSSENQFEILSRKSNADRNSMALVNLNGRLSTNSINKRSRKKRNSEKISVDLRDKQLEIMRENVGLNPPSLIDLGANSYLNSAFLAIASCTRYVEDMKDLRLKYKTGLEKLSIFNELIKIVNGNSTSRARIANNRVFKSWNKLYQQDSFEILEYVINQVYNEIRKYRIETGDKSINYIYEWLKIDLPMRFVLEYRIFCKCGRPLQMFLQSDLAIHVPVPINNEIEIDVQTLINQFFSNDLIEQYDCIQEGCNKNEAIRYTRLRQPLPNTICVHLQRIFWNGFQMEKIINNLNFSMDLIIKSDFFVKDNLDLNPEQFYLNSEPPENNNKYLIKHPNKIKYEELENFANTKIEPQSNQSFKLVSVLVHEGSMYGGQYDCYKYVNGIWFLVNENQVMQVDEHEVFNCKAQVLFYENNKMIDKK